jgi:outer membrane protein assembly factor BamE
MVERRLSYSHFTALQTAHPSRFFAGANGFSVCGLILVALLVSACNLITPYRVDIQQGNVVTQEMIGKLQPGMTRSQVRFALGTPLVVDPFRQDRWDYVYLLMKQGEVKERRRIIVVFKDDKLVGFEGDVVPLFPDRSPDRAIPDAKPAPAGAPAAPTPAGDPDKKSAPAPAGDLDKKSAPTTAGDLEKP